MEVLELLCLSGQWDALGAFVDQNLNSSPDVLDDMGSTIIRNVRPADFDRILTPLRLVLRACLEARGDPTAHVQNLVAEACDTDNLDAFCLVDELIGTDAMKQVLSWNRNSRNHPVMICIRSPGTAILTYLAAEYEIDFSLYRVTTGPENHHSALFLAFVQPHNPKAFDLILEDASSLRMRPMETPLMFFMALVSLNVFNSAEKVDDAFKRLHTLLSGRKHFPPDYKITREEASVLVKLSKNRLQYTRVEWVTSFVLSFGFFNGSLSPLEAVVLFLKCPGAHAYTESFFWTLALTLGHQEGGIILGPEARSAIWKRNTQPKKALEDVAFFNHWVDLMIKYAVQMTAITVLVQKKRLRVVTSRIEHEPYRKFHHIAARLPVEIIWRIFLLAAGKDRNLPIKGDILEIFEKDVMESIK